MDCWRLVRRSATVIWTIFLLLFFTLFLVPLGRSAAVTPVADWEFDEGSGNTALDSSGNGHDAMLSNGARWDETVDGWAVSGDGVQGTVSTPPLNLTETHAVSVSFWAERNYTTAEGGGALFATGRSDASSTTGFSLLPDNSTCHGIQAEFRGNVGTTSNCYSQPSSGVWHHLVVVMDKSRTGGDAIAFYVDGVLQNPNWNLSSATNTNNFGNDPLYLFSRNGDSQFATGSIRKFRVYDTALNAEQVAQLYADSKPQGAPTAGLVAAYAFNEGSGSKVADASGNGNTGTIANAAWTEAGKFGKALVFNGTSSLVTIPDSSSLHLKSAMTLEAWVNPSVSLCNGGEMIAKGSDDYFLGGCSSGGGGPGAGATLNLSKVATYGRAQVPANTWTHLAVTYNGAAFSLYQNGEKVSTRFYRGNIAESFRALQIGGNSLLGQHFRGAIDELRIYDVALTRAQIENDMNAPIQAALQSITITPDNAALTVGEERQLRATGTYSDGSQQDLTQDVAWTSSSSAIATISSSGMVSGISVGKTTLQGRIGAKLVSIEVYVGPANFTIAASPSLLTIAQGSQGTSTITSTTYNGFNCAVYFSARGLPTGATVSFVPNHIAAPGSGNSIMTISVGANTAVGSYPITVTAMAGTIQLRTATVTLTVTAPPDFTIGANPSSVSVVQGQQGSSMITTTVSGGFNSAINLSATGVPNGTTVSFSPNPIAAPGNGSSTMTVAVGGNTAVGSYPITVSGSGEGIQRATVVTLTVTSIALDGNVHGGQDSGSNATNTESVSIGTPSAGDLITCEVAFNSGNNNALVAVGDNNNGSYTAAIPINLDGDMQQWFGIYYIENVSNSPTTVTVQTTQSEPNLAVSCQAWIGVDVSDSLDEGFSQLQNEVSAPDPSTGVDKMPASDGELVIAAVGLHKSGMPTAGGNYSLIDGAPYTQWWPEYWIQMIASSTAGNYNWPMDTWADSMAAFLPASSRNFTLSASPRSLSVAQGQQGNSRLTTTIRHGFNSAIMFSASGVPDGTTVSFNPNPIAAPGNGSSTMTINVGANTAVGTYPITVSGNGGGIEHSTRVTLTVTDPPDYSVSANPAAVSVAQGSQGTSSISTTISGGFNSAITLSASGVPNGTTVSFNPNPIAAPGNGSSTMTINVGANTAVGTYPITVSGNGGGIQHSTTVTLTVTDPPDFTISASPMALSLLQGSQGTSTITTTISGGFNGAINLLANGVPNGTIVSFSPNPIAAPGNGSSTMTITVGMNTLQGTYPVVITGSGGGIQHSVTLTLTVTAEVFLSWNPSGSQGVAGYNVYRSLTTGGPYTKINSGLVADTNYADLAVQDGQTYYYVATAVDQQQQESVYCNEASAYVP